MRTIIIPATHKATIRTAVDTSLSARLSNVLVMIALSPIAATASIKAFGLSTKHIIL